MAAGNLVRLLISIEGFCESFCQLKNSTERGVGVEVLAVDFDGAAQRGLAGRRIGVHCPFRTLRDFIFDDAFLAPRLTVARCDGSRSCKLLQRFFPDLTIATQDSELHPR